ncbi:unnamed protein product [Rotaria sp. Silwood1]|nr:unnamed protein product [Rotaria sp. Silwood1]
MATAVNDAAIVCCFMTPEYENSEYCKLELEHAQKLGKPIIPCMVSDREVWRPSPRKWLSFITGSILSIDFSNISEENIVTKVNELIDRIKNRPSSSVIEPSTSPSILIQSIKQEYLRNDHIQRMVNEEKSFPIEQSYINLAIIENKEQQEKEKKLCNTQQDNTIIDTFEEIYGTKTAIDVKDLFKNSKDQTKKILVLGRAGIGKSTFCRYVTYRWAKGEIWSEYELVILIQLRLLTTNRYPLSQNYSPIDLLKREHFPYDDLLDADRRRFKEKCDKGQVLWILDGYDEFVQNTSEQLKDVFEYIRKTQHHILTSRPYAITLPYQVTMEITGFTDDNIVKYVNQFFSQIQDELKEASSQGQKLLEFLKSNRSIWGIAHIPVNLELICSLWGDNEQPETKTLTITALYSKITQWLCRRYLTKQQNMNTEHMTNERVRQHCEKELTFLETIAFHAMQDNTIILSPKLLKGSEEESKCLLDDSPQLLNIGILKSLNDKPTGCHIESERQHYFIHLSFQEHFAARYLITILNSSSPEKAIDFVKHHKYNRRFALVFSFMSGLLMQNNSKKCMELFWDTILGEPLDLVGLRHIQLIISCIEETVGMSSFRQRNELMHSIVEWIKIAVSVKYYVIFNELANSLGRTTSLVHEPCIQDTLIELLQNEKGEKKEKVLCLVSKLLLSNPSHELVNLLLIERRNSNTEGRNDALKALCRLDDKAIIDNIIIELVSMLTDENDDLRHNACEQLIVIRQEKPDINFIHRLLPLLGDTNHNVRCYSCQVFSVMGEKAATNDVINSLITALRDENHDVKVWACRALGNMGEKAATNDVISGLMTALGDENENVRNSACYALANIGEKAAINDVINGLMTVLGDEKHHVRVSACRVLENMGKKAATNDVINGLVTALRDEDEDVRNSACYVLANMGETAATNDVINGLMTALGDEKHQVRGSACYALGNIGEKAATNDVISGLMTALGDEKHHVRVSACYALANIGEKAATNDVINGLMTALGDEKHHVRVSACRVLRNMGKKAVTNDVINGLMIALEDEDEHVRTSAYEALGNMGEKAATNDVINGLMTALGDEKHHVRVSACRVFGNMGKKAATNDVINGLMTALGDEDEFVRNSACEALGNMGEKAATNDVINGILNVLDGSSYNSAFVASTALIGEEFLNDIKFSNVQSMHSVRSSLKTNKKHEEYFSLQSIVKFC